MRSYQLAGAINGRPAQPGKSGTYFSSMLYYVDIDDADRLILSSNPDGTGDISADDAIDLRLTDMKDSTNKARFFHDFSRGCSGGIEPSGPVDLNESMKGLDKLRGKMVKVSIDITDKCGGMEGCTSLYLVIK